MELYLKSDLPEKSYYKAMAGCAVRGYMNTVLKIFEDKVNKENVRLVILEFEDFCKPDAEEQFDENKHLNEKIKFIYDKLKDIYIGLNYFYNFFLFFDIIYYKKLRTIKYIS